MRIGEVAIVATLKSELPPCLARFLLFFSTGGVDVQILGFFILTIDGVLKNILCAQSLSNFSFSFVN